MAIWEFMLDRQLLDDDSFVQIACAIETVTRGIPPESVAAHRTLLKRTTDFMLRHHVKRTTSTAYRLLWQLREKYPTAEEAQQSPPWEKATLLAETDGTTELLSLLVSDDFVTGLERTDGTAYRLLRIPLSGAKPVLRGIGARERPDYVLCHDEKFLFASESRALRVYPLDGSQPLRLTAADGLPQEFIACCARLDDTVYLSSQSAFAAYDLKEHKGQVLASTQRRERMTPLDALNTMRASGMVPDPVHHRVVFRIETNTWQFDVASGVFSRIENATPLEDYCTAKVFVKEQVPLSRLVDGEEALPVGEDKWYGAPFRRWRDSSQSYQLFPRVICGHRHLAPIGVARGGKAVVVGRKGDYWAIALLELENDSAGQTPARP